MSSILRTTVPHPGSTSTSKVARRRARFDPERSFGQRPEPPYFIWNTRERDRAQWNDGRRRALAASNSQRLSRGHRRTLDLWRSPAPMPRRRRCRSCPILCNDWLRRDDPVVTDLGYAKGADERQKGACRDVSCGRGRRARPFNHGRCGQRSEARQEVMQRL